MTLTIILAVAAVLVLGAVLLVTRGLRRLRRRIADLRWRVRAVQAKVMTPGPKRDAALLRHRLQAELRATRDMLEAAPDGLIFRADATAVLAELGSTAAEVDRELATIERFLDAGQQRSALRTLRPQAELLIDTTYSARQTILRTAAEDRARHLTELQANVARQAAALDVYKRSDRELQL